MAEQSSGMTDRAESIYKDILEQHPEHADGGVLDNTARGPLPG